MIERREISPVEITRVLLDRIDALDGDLHWYARLMAEDAMAAAHASEAALAVGHNRGLLDGVPVGVKDLFWTKGVATAAGSVVHRDFVPSRDATAVDRLRAIGAIILGKLRCCHLWTAPALQG